MSVETRKLVQLWKSMRANREEGALATVIRVAGSSYRKPGARMMITRSGLRVGTVSGGCLEGEVSKKIWWLTEGGPAVKDYNTAYDDDSQANHGLGCDGVVSLLLERTSEASGVLEALRVAVEERTPSAIVTVVSTDSADVPVGSRLIITSSQDLPPATGISAELERLLLPMALDVLESAQSSTASMTLAGKAFEVCGEYVAPPAALFVFGAGDDAQPLAKLAAEMGWEVSIADGRSNLSSQARFPTAQRVAILSLDDPLKDLPIAPGDAAVVLTHSYQQDFAILRHLLPLPLGYLGVLGPKRRTMRIVDEIARLTGVDRREALGTLRSPVGLDLGAGSPEIIALSIIAEIQAALTQRSAAPLHLASSPELLFTATSGE
ncbi:Xanthine and CO dehydrogenases maturation factor, XdhC/CoxF family [Acidisarcina polymorpha]|uniref:Xanthine and CO dehydrogenases maturation factor, XdhC/CoxF family n=1 Tax=Acidisarcina polymorpha TaxID=2211140 RepID=A0A2Z5FSY5_9BACT|nr:XdhC/CoxI family protein [Acidisarcina polymorpha]AXC09586.1 Xanthine and CO dehydrogenases maturation factor, XdhC/CoxF family [Acidisarcina polymorpha]